MGGLSEKRSSSTYVRRIDEAKKEMASLRKQFSDNGWKETALLIMF